MSYTLHRKSELDLRTSWIGPGGLTRPYGRLVSSRPMQCLHKFTNSKFTDGRPFSSCHSHGIGSCGYMWACTSKTAHRTATHCLYPSLCDSVLRRIPNEFKFLRGSQAPGPRRRRSRPRVTLSLTSLTGPKASHAAAKTNACLRCGGCHSCGWQRSSTSVATAL